MLRGRIVGRWLCKACGTHFDRSKVSARYIGSNSPWRRQRKTSANPALALTNNLRYPGQYLDRESGLHYNDRRYYDPSSGRCTTRDPIGFEGGINLYTYAAAAPNRFTDPTGEIIPCLVYNYLRCMAIGGRRLCVCCHPGSTRPGAPACLPCSGVL